MKRIGLGVAGGVTLLALLAAAGAVVENTPFFYAEPTLADPQIKSANIGSTDSAPAASVLGRKYVTLDLNPRDKTFQGFTNFTFPAGEGGFVGLLDPPAPQTTKGPGGRGFARGANPTPSIKQSPSEIEAAANPSILERPGMTFVAPLGGSPTP